MASLPQVPPRPAPVHLGARPLVVQGSFLGSRLQIRGRPTHSGAIQLSTRGPATQLPPALLSLRPHGAGQRLPEAIQRKMEAFFKADFSDVRVHVGHEASSIGALAFTQGSNIYFAHGQYNPNLSHGQRLIGHELTHVLQQRTGRVRNPFGMGIAVVQDPGLEAEAERMAVQIATARFESSGALQRRVHPARVVQKMMGSSTIEEAEVKEVQSSGPKTCGSYAHDVPQPLTAVEWEEIKHLMEFTNDELKPTMLKIGEKNPSYDCSNWSLGYQVARMQSPPVTPDGIIALYTQCGFKRTETPQEAVIAVYLDENNFARHVAVKLPITYNGETKQTWTSKLGASYLITHNKVKDLTGYPSAGFILFEKGT